jgi:hypothetical protein
VQGYFLHLLPPPYLPSPFACEHVAIPLQRTRRGRLDAAATRAPRRQASSPSPTCGSSLSRCWSSHLNSNHPSPSRRRSRLRRSPRSRCHPHHQSLPQHRRSRRRRQHRRGRNRRCRNRPNLRSRSPRHRTAARTVNDDDACPTAPVATRPATGIAPAASAPARAAAGGVGSGIGVEETGQRVGQRRVPVDGHFVQFIVVHIVGPVGRAVLVAVRSLRGGVRWKSPRNTPPTRQAASPR